MAIFDLPRATEYGDPTPISAQYLGMLAGEHMVSAGINFNTFFIFARLSAPLYRGKRLYDNQPAFLTSHSDVTADVYARFVLVLALSQHMTGAYPEKPEHITDTWNTLHAKLTRLFSAFADDPRTVEMFSGEVSKRLRDTNSHPADPNVAPYTLLAALLDAHPDKMQALRRMSEAFAEKVYKPIIYKQRDPNPKFWK